LVQTTTLATFFLRVLTEVFLNLTEVFLNLTEVFLNLTEVFLTLTEVLPWFFLSCKANARVKLAKTGHGLHSSTLAVICVVRFLCVLFYVLFVCKCVLPPGDNPIAVNKYINQYQIAKSDCYLLHVRMSVRPSIRMELGSHWADFYEI